MTEPLQSYDPSDIPQRADLLWAAVDLDGTLAEGIWTPDNPVDVIGKPLPDNVAKAKKLVADGWKVVIHTSRPWTDYERIERWLNYHDIPFRSIVCGKLLARIYVDDRAVNANQQTWSTDG